MSMLCGVDPVKLYCSTIPVPYNPAGDNVKKAYVSLTSTTITNFYCKYWIISNLDKCNFLPDPVVFLASSKLFWAAFITLFRASLLS